MSSTWTSPESIYVCAGGIAYCSQRFSNFSRISFRHVTLSRTSYFGTNPLSTNTFNGQLFFIVDSNELCPAKLISMTKRHYLHLYILCHQMCENSEIYFNTCWQVVTVLTWVILSIFLIRWHVGSGYCEDILTSIHHLSRYLGRSMQQCNSANCALWLCKSIVFRVYILNPIPWLICIIEFDTKLFISEYRHRKHKKTPWYIFVDRKPEFSCQKLYIKIQCASAQSDSKEETTKYVFFKCDCLVTGLWF